MKIAPTVLNSLLTFLDERYPNTLPTTSIDENQLNRLIGQQDVIRCLEEILERSEA